MLTGGEGGAGGQVTGRGPCLLKHDELFFD